jgi:hypothetical protein
MRVPVQSPRTRVALIGICGAAIVLAVLAGFGVFSGSSGASLPPLPTTGDYRPITVSSPVNGALADPDSMSRQGQDLSSVLAQGGGAHSYRVTVSNISSIGFVNALDWRPPSGMRLVRITGSSAGHCRLAAGTDPRITCAGLRLKPPTCTCRGDGGELVISFVADSKVPGLLAGASAIVSASPVLNVIPAYPQGPDVSRCKPGQLSTTSNPCASG